MTETGAPALAVLSFFDGATNTVSHVAYDETTRRAAIIDPVLDYDPASGRIATGSADALVDAVEGGNLAVEWILETHAHADHLSAAPYLRERLGGRIGIGRHITAVQDAFGQLLALGSDFVPDGRQFDHLFDEGETFRLGDIDASVMATPGHTPACVTYVIGDAAFVGDTLFQPDFGTARCDFPGGDPRDLYRSIHRILSLPPETRLFTCHDYMPGGREPAWESTVAEQSAENIHVGNGASEEDFVAMRTQRDAVLSMPRLILPSIQVNIRAGDLPEPEDNGVRYLKIPLNAL